MYNERDMSWRDLLQTEQNIEKMVLPWLGGRFLQLKARSWTIGHPLPQEHGWYLFALDGRRARIIEKADVSDQGLVENPRGYLVGDRLVRDGVSSRCTDYAGLLSCSDRVHLIEPGLDRFVRVDTGRFWYDGPLVFQSQSFPLGPENDVLQAFLDAKESVKDIPGVSPALDMAFQLETWRRAEAERRRKEEQERLEKEERRRRIQEQLGDGQLRRQVAQEDFGEAAKAALTVGGAEFLDHRVSGHSQNEMVVRFRLDGRRFECTCDRRTLGIIDSGICLQDHATGRRDDNLLTLESLPSVIREADREGVLVVFRHVN